MHAHTPPPTHLPLGDGDGGADHALRLALAPLRLIPPRELCHLLALRLLLREALGRGGLRSRSLASALVCWGRRRRRCQRRNARQQRRRQHRAGRQHEGVAFLDEAQGRQQCAGARRAQQARRERRVLQSQAAELGLVRAARDVGADGVQRGKRQGSVGASGELREGLHKQEVGRGGGNRARARALWGLWVWVWVWVWVVGQMSTQCVLDPGVLVHASEVW